MTVSGRWKQRKSARGHTFRVWRVDQPMPFIEQCFLDCSIYLYGSKQSAEAGENFGGSGCLVSVLSPPVSLEWAWPKTSKRVSAFPPHLYAVTNKHVAQRGFPVIRLNTVDGKTDVLELDHNDWIPHPDGDDLAIAPVDLPANKHHYFPVDSDLFVKRENLYTGEPSNDLIIGAGDDTFMVGRFISHAGGQKNTPSLRFGSIAMLPFEKVKLAEVAGSYMQEAFLVETRSISGFSGSPVFVYQPQGEAFFLPDYGWEERITDLVGQPRLLGIDCSHIQKFDKVVDGQGNPHPHGWKVSANTGMAIVIPAWRLEQLLNLPELVMQRNQKNKKYQEEKESEESVVMDTETPAPFTEETYQDALRRASRKVSEPSEPDSKRSRTSE